MKKKLKIKFWKTARALAMQIIEQEGLPRIKKSGKVKITENPSYCGDEIWLRGESRGADNYILSFYFEFQYEVENKIKKITQAITDELFTSDSELKVGETCEVSSCPSSYWCTRKLIAILPDNYRNRFITQSDDNANDWFYYKYARPFRKRIEPKVETNGEIETYTWEEE